MEANKYEVSVCRDFIHANYDTITEIGFEYKGKIIIFNSESHFFGTSLRNKVYGKTEYGSHDTSVEIESPIEKITIDVETAEKIYQSIVSRDEAKEMIEKYLPESKPSWKSRVVIH